MYKILKNIIEMDDYSVQKLSNLQPPEPFEWNTVEGTELNISDCIGGKGKIEVKGNTYQKQLSGKNLVNNTAQSQTIRGVVFTKNKDGSVLVNGTATDLVIFNLIGNNTFILPAGKYTISGCPTGGNDSTYRLDINNGTVANQRDYGSGSTFTLNEDFTVNNVRIRIASGATVNNLLFKPMIEQDVTATDYEPYCGGQAAPNPSYEIPIKVVTGDNVVKHFGMNLFDFIANLNTEIAGLSISSDKAGNIIVNGTPTRSWVTIVQKVNITDFLEDGQTYTLWQENIESNGGRPWFYVQVGYGENTASNYYSVTTASNMLKFTVDKSKNNIYQIMVQTGNNLVNYNNVKNRFMLLKGDYTNKEIAYEPYRGEEYELSLGTMELCKIGDYSDILFKNEIGDENYKAELESGVWYEKDIIKKRILNGSETLRGTGINNIYYYAGITNYTRNNNIPLCSHFNGFDTVDSAAQIEGINRIGFNNTYDYNRFYISFDGTIEELANLLAEKTPTLYYATDNPTYTKITDPTLISQLEALRKAKWFKDVNHWWTETNNLEPVLKGTYRQAINE